MKQKKPTRKRRAAIMIVALAALLAVTLSGAQLLRSLARSHRQWRQDQWAIQALWLADSGVARATARLDVDADYAGETWQPQIEAGANSASAAKGRVVIVVQKDPANAVRRHIRIEAIYPDDPSRRAQQTREQVISLTQHGDSR